MSQLFTLKTLDAQFLIILINIQLINLGIINILNKITTYFIVDEIVSVYQSHEIFFGYLEDEGEVQSLDAHEDGHLVEEFYLTHYYLLYSGVEYCVGFLVEELYLSLD